MTNMRKHFCEQKVKQLLGAFIAICIIYTCPTCMLSFVTFFAVSLSTRYFVSFTIHIFLFMSQIFFTYFFCCCHFIFTTFYVVCKYVMRNVEARKSIRMIQLIMAHLCHCLNFIINFIINFKVNHIKFSSILIRRLSTHKIIDFPYAL